MTLPPVETAVGNPLDSTIEGGTPQIGLFLILILLAVGGIYIAGELTSNLSGLRTSSVWPFVLLGFALLIALGFEFVNGFHDTANAVATVIYTHSLPPHIAVVWSGMWNFIGVMLASGAVACGIVALLHHGLAGTSSLVPCTSPHCRPGSPLAVLARIAAS